jgi:acyl-coenzyme A thioesterase PaaI-like protein
MAENEELRFPLDSGCFGCSPSNPIGLRMTFRRDGDRIVARYAIPEHFHGAPGIAHGGIVAALLDEVSCAAVHFLRGRFVVTGELSVRYRAPCPVGRPLVLSAWFVAEDHPRYAVVDADVREDGVLVAHSTGRFFFQDRREPAP